MVWSKPILRTPNLETGGYWINGPVCQVAGCGLGCCDMF